MLEIMYPNDICTVVEQLDYDPEIKGQKPDATWLTDKIAELQKKVIDCINFKSNFYNKTQK